MLSKSEINPATGLLERVFSETSLPFLDLSHRNLEFKENDQIFFISESCRWPMMVLKDQINAQKEVKDLLLQQEVYLVESTEHRTKISSLLKYFGGPEETKKWRGKNSLHDSLSFSKK